MNNNDRKGFGSGFGRFDIRNYVDQLTKAKEPGKYICPACGGHNLSISLKTREFKCFNCEDTKKITSILTEPERQHTEWAREIDQRAKQYRQQQRLNKLAKENPGLTPEEIEYVAAIDDATGEAIAALSDTEKQFQAYLKELNYIAHEPDSQRQEFLKSRMAQKYRTPISKIEDGILSVLGMAPPEVKELSVKELIESTANSAGHFLVPGIPKVGVTLLSGRHGSGKTSLLYHLAKAVNEGSFWFGEPPAVRGKTLFVSSDEPDSDAADKADKIGLADDSVIFLLNWQVKDWEKLVAAIRSHNPALIQIDSFTGIHDHSFDENARSAALTILRLQQLSSEHQIPIVVTHHLAKDGTIRGSSSIPAACSSTLILEGRKDEPRHLYSDKCRGAYVDYRFRWNWDLTIEEISGFTSESELSNRDKILQLLQGGKRLEVEEISELTGLEKKQIKNCLYSLLSTSLVASEPSKTRPKNKVYFVTSTLLTTPPTPSVRLNDKFIAETITEKEIQDKLTIDLLIDLPDKSILEEVNNKSINKSIPKPTHSGLSDSLTYSDESDKGGGGLTCDNSDSCSTSKPNNDQQQSTNSQSVNKLPLWVMFKGKKWSVKDSVGGFYSLSEYGKLKPEVTIARLNECTDINWG